MLTLPPSKRFNQAIGFLVVGTTMVAMFTIPRSYFALGSIVSTATMICVAYFLLRREVLGRPTVLNIILAVFVAILLYLLFVAGNLGIRAYPLYGLSPSGEQNIYGLFANVPVPLLVIVLVLDAFGFELYFRGNILTNLSQKIGFGSVFATAAIDACIHLSTFNLLFPATTFVADSMWGFYYFKTRDLSSTILCHFVWDIIIFILIPIH